VLFTVAELLVEIVDSYIVFVIVILLQLNSLNFTAAVFFCLHPQSHQMSYNILVPLSGIPSHHHHHKILY